MLFVNIAKKKSWRRKKTLESPSLSAVPPDLTFIPYYSQLRTLGKVPVIFPVLLPNSRQSHGRPLPFHCRRFCQPSWPASFTPCASGSVSIRVPGGLFCSTFAPYPHLSGSPGVSAFRPHPTPPCLCLIKLKWCHLAESFFLGLSGWVFFPSFFPSGAVLSLLSVSLAPPAPLSSELLCGFPRCPVLSCDVNANGLFRNQEGSVATARPFQT